MERNHRTGSGECFLLPGELPAKEVVAALGERFPVGRARRFSEAWTYFDTFDWRLASAGAVLAARRLGAGWEVVCDAPGEARRRRQRVSEAPGLVAELPAGPVREAVAAACGIRRLLPLVTVECRGLRVPILDGQEKTVVRVQVEEVRTARCQEALQVEPLVTAPAGGEADGALPRRLRLEPLRGYGPESAPVAAFCARELELEATEVPDLAVVLEACGRRIGDYSSRIRVELQPELSAEEAMGRILRHLLTTMLANEAGVRRELDPEFLHDFRVAVRRARSALGQVKEVFPAEQVTGLRKELRWLGRITGPKRDHDVLVENLEGILADLPAWVGDGLGRLEAFIRAKEVSEQRDLVAALGSARYRRLVRDWRRFVDGAPPAAAAVDEVPANAGRPAGQVASEHIWKVARRVRERAAVVDEATPPEAIHRLRIECKKLRYLLELFRSLFPAGEIEPLVKALKGLQDVLGAYNDLAVQQGSVKALSLEMAGAGQAPPEALLAVGYLLAFLEARQGEVRRLLGKALGKYLRRRNQDLLERLVAPDARGAA